MVRTTVNASPFNCRWIPVALTHGSAAPAYAVCVRNGPHVVSERECLDCPHWQSRISTKPYGFRGTDDTQLD